MTPLERGEAAIGPLFMEDLPDLSAIVRAVVAMIRDSSVEQVKVGKKQTEQQIPRRTEARVATMARKRAEREARVVS